MTTDEAVTRLLSKKDSAYPNSKRSMDNYLIKYLPPSVLKKQSPSFSRQNTDQTINQLNANAKYDFNQLDNFDQQQPMTKLNVPSHLKSPNKRRKGSLFAKNSRRGSRRLQVAGLASPNRSSRTRSKDKNKQFVKVRLSAVGRKSSTRGIMNGMNDFV